MFFALTLRARRKEAQSRENESVLLTLTVSFASEFNTHISGIHTFRFNVHAGQPSIWISGKIERVCRLVTIAVKDNVFTSDELNHLSASMSVFIEVMRSQAFLNALRDSKQLGRLLENTQYTRKKIVDSLFSTYRHAVNLSKNDDMGAYVGSFCPLNRKAPCTFEIGPKFLTGTEISRTTATAFFMLYMIDQGVESKIIPCVRDIFSQTAYNLGLGNNRLKAANIPQNLIESKVRPVLASPRPRQQHLEYPVDPNVHQKIKKDGKNIEYFTKGSSVNRNEELILL